MGDVPQAIPEAPGTYQAGGGMIVSKLPDEPGVPVRRDQFDILCEGGVAEARASRDVCLGILGAALAGIIGVLATTEWDSVWKPDRRWPFIFWVVVLLIMVSGSGVGALIYEIRRRTTKTNSPYSRVVAQLTKLYDAQRSE
jgi:hypothetical protein